MPLALAFATLSDLVPELSSDLCKVAVEIPCRQGLCEGSVGHTGASVRTGWGLRGAGGRGSPRAFLPATGSLSSQADLGTSLWPWGTRNGWSGTIGSVPPKSWHLLDQAGLLARLGQSSTCRPSWRGVQVGVLRKRRGHPSPFGAGDVCSPRLPCPEVGGAASIQFALQPCWMPCNGSGDTRRQCRAEGRAGSGPRGEPCESGGQGGVLVWE